MRSFVFASLASLAAVKSTQAHPAHGGHRTLNRRGIDLDSYRFDVPVDYTNANAVGADASISSLTRRSTAEDTASELVKKIVPGATFRMADNYVGSNGVSHIYFKQTANGLDVDNGDFNVNVSNNIALGSFAARSLTIFRLAATARSSVLETPSSVVIFLLHLQRPSVITLSRLLLSNLQSAFWIFLCRLPLLHLSQRKLRIPLPLSNPVVRFQSPKPASFTFKHPRASLR
jgi:hypothetical protein